MLIPVNNPNFPIQIRQYGSRFRCLLGIAEFHLDKELSIEKIAKIYDIARNMPEVMDESCFCTQEDHRLTKMAFLALKIIIFLSDKLSTVPDRTERKLLVYLYADGKIGLTTVLENGKQKKKNIMQHCIIKQGLCCQIFGIRFG